MNWSSSWSSCYNRCVKRGSVPSQWPSRNVRLNRWILFPSLFLFFYIHVLYLILKLSIRHQFFLQLDLFTFRLKITIYNWWVQASPAVVIQSFKKFLSLNESLDIHWGGLKTLDTKELFFSNISPQTKSRQFVMDKKRFCILLPTPGDLYENFFFHQFKFTFSKNKKREEKICPALRLMKVVCGCTL